MVALAKEENAKQMINSCRDLVTSTFGADDVEQPADGCIAFFLEHISHYWKAPEEI